MLTELTIKNFAIIDELHLAFTGGFNVLTGETGAGKSIIIDAVSLLLGGRATSDVVRADTKSAVVEGQFHLPKTLQRLITPILEREGLEGDSPDVLTLGREIRATGRNFSRVNGRTVSAGLLAEIAAPLVDIHGQHEHLSLLRPKMHGAFLDRFGGLGDQRRRVSDLYRAMQKVRRELQRLTQDAQQLARRIDQLTFQMDEIQVADLHPGEEDDLNTERTRLANAEKISQLTGEAYRLLVEGNDEQPAAGDLLGQVARVLSALLRIDNSAQPMSELAESIVYQTEDLAGQLQTYAEAIEFSPERLQEVEERLGLIYHLKRKYGASIAEILTFGEQAQAELDSISHSEERIEALQAKETDLRRELGTLAAELSAARRTAGDALARGVETELQALSMERTQFFVNLEHTPAEDGVFAGPSFNSLARS